MRWSGIVGTGRKGTRIGLNRFFAYKETGQGTPGKGCLVSFSLHSDSVGV